MSVHSEDFIGAEDDGGGEWGQLQLVGMQSSQSYYHQCRQTNTLPC